MLDENKTDNKTFYFTYGTDDQQPFWGGWTEVEAPDARAACAVFRAYHPDRDEGVLNCADIYTEEEFERTEMRCTGNFGYRCRERITVTRDKYPPLRIGADFDIDRLRLRELIQAEKDGRLVILPAPLGDGKLAYGLTDPDDGPQKIATLEFLPWLK